MLGVHQPVQVAGAPPGYQVDADFERRSDRPNPIDRLRPHVATLEARNERARDVRPLSHIDLSPPTALADKPDDRPETLVMHGPSVVGGAQPGLTGTVSRRSVGRGP